MAVEAPAIEKNGKASAKGNGNRRANGQDAKANPEIPSLLPAEEYSEVEEKTNIVLVIVAVISILIVIAAVVLAMFYIFVRYDVNGFAAKNLNTLRSVPILRQAIPERYRDETSYVYVPSDTSSLSNVQLRRMVENLEEERQGIINEIEALKRQAVEYQRQIEEMDSQIDAALHSSDQKIEEISSQIAEIEERELQLQKDKAELDRIESELNRAIGDFYSKVAEGDREGLAMYFERVHPEIAAGAYEEWLEQRRLDDDKQNFIRTMQSLEARTISRVFEEMSVDDYDTVFSIFVELRRDLQVEVLSALTPAFAARVTKSLADLYMQEE